MSARDAVLARLRRAVTQSDGRAEAVRTRLADPRQTAPVPAQGQVDGAARLAQFVAKAEAADATVSRIARLDDLPAALAALLRDRNLPAAIRTGSDPALTGLEWGGIERSEGPGRIDEPVTLSRAEFGVAETGTLVLASGPYNPVTLTFLGETHVVVLETARVMAGFEDMFAAWRALGRDPRTLNMVTGPSRSADIGQTLQLGAHGPVALHIVLAGDG